MRIISTNLEMMTERRLCQIIWLGVLTIRIDTNLQLDVVGSLGNDNAFECGKEVTLTCTSKPYENNIAWIRENITLAGCAFTHCFTIPPFLGNYAFQQSIENGSGISNLKINPVQINDNGIEFKCSNGSNEIPIQAAVKVLPENTTTTFTYTRTGSTTQINVVTGCVFPAEKIKFIWYKYTTSTSPEQYMTMTSDSVNNSNCIPTSACKGSGVVGSLTIEEDLSGTETYFQVVIEHPDALDKKAIVSSQTVFRLKDSNDSEDCYRCFSKFCLRKYGCILIYTVISVIGVVPFIVVGAFLMKKNKVVNEYGLLQDMLANVDSTTCDTLAAQKKEEIIVAVQGLADVINQHVTESSLEKQHLVTFDCKPYLETCMSSLHRYHPEGFYNNDTLLTALYHCKRQLTRNQTAINDHKLREIIHLMEQLEMMLCQEEERKMLFPYYDC